MWGKVTKKVSYEDATKWYNDCNPPYPKYHPGDWFAYQDICHEDCTEHVYLCAEPCIAKGYPIAAHVEGGYYTDGSYYAKCSSLENIHPTKDRHKKTQWQADRDECLQDTYENVKRKHFWSSIGSWMNDSKAYYKECIKEKGYDTERLRNANKKSEGVS